MVEICVGVADPSHALGLMRGLARVFERSSVSFDRTRSEVRVRSEWESRAVIQVIDAVESWLATDGLGSATLSIGDRSYTLIGPICSAGAHGRAALSGQATAALLSIFSGIQVAWLAALAYGLVRILS